MITAFCLAGVLFGGVANSLYTRRTTTGAADSFRLFIRARWAPRAYWLSGLLMVPLIATADVFSPWNTAVTLAAIIAAYGAGFVGTFALVQLALDSRGTSNRPCR